MRVIRGLPAAFLILVLLSCDRGKELVTSLKGCADEITTGIRPIAQTRDRRFLGKVQPNTAQCRGGDVAVQRREPPWVDWRNYYGTGDASTKGWGTQTKRGITGALIDLEYERAELIKFNLFDNSGTYRQYIG